MRVFLTGASGFIGKHILRTLQNNGHTVFSHSFSADGKLDDVPEDIDLVVNSAGRLGGSGYPDAILREANLDLPVNLAKICRTRGIPMTHLSTPGVCGLRAMGRETDEYAPEGVYEKTKAQAETEILRILPGVSILRPDYVFGTGDMHKFPLFKQVSRGWFPLIGKGDARTRPTDVEDVAEAVLESFPSGPLYGGIFNIGGPDVLTVRETARVIAGVFGKRLLTLPIPRFVFRAALKLGPACPKGLSRSRYRLFGTDRFVDTTKASEAGFNARHSFSRTAEAAVEWYKKTGLL